MKLTIFYGKVDELEGKVNMFLANLPTNDIYNVDVVACPSEDYEIDRVAVFIWTKA